MNQRTWLWPLIAIALVIVLLSTVDSGDWIGLLVPVLVGVAYYIAVEGGRRMGIPIGRARADRLLAFLAMAAIFLTSTFIISSVTWSLTLGGAGGIGILIAIGTARGRLEPRTSEDEGRASGGA